MLRVRQYVALLRHRRGFLLGILSVFVLACVCQVIANTNVVLHGADATGKDLAAGFGDAFIIAGVLALLVDPVAQHQFAAEWGRDLYWAIFSPNAPHEFRDALQALAAPLGYIHRCNYELEFRHPGGGQTGYFEMEWRVSLSGVVLDRRGFHPIDRVFVVGRHDGLPSAYTLWSFQGEDSDRLTYDESELESLGAISTDDGGLTILDQGKIPKLTHVPFNHRYWSDRHLSTSRSEADYLVLFQSRTVLSQSIVIKGAPVADLDVVVIQLGGQQPTLIPQTRPGGRLELHCEIDRVSVPGQACLVSWKPKKTPKPCPAERA